MPNINLHLEPLKPINPVDLNALFNSLNILHKKQKEALICLLCNVAKYQSAKILFSRRNEATQPKQYNPNRLGNKPLISVIEKLKAAKLLKVTRGIPRYIAEEDPKKSSFEALPSFVKFCQSLVKVPTESSRSFVELRTKRDKLKEFQPTPYTDHISALMKNYCDFLNKQTISVDDEIISNIFLVRKYKDRLGDGSFQFGGRTHHPFMSYSKEKRKRILINGKKTVSVDYPASLSNILYKTITGRPLAPEDPYEVDGIPRSIVKKFSNIMLNTSSERETSGAINKWLKTEATEVNKRDYAKAKAVMGGNAKIMKAIQERNRPIAHCYFQGKIMGQHYAWLESNLVFEVAYFFAEHLKIPALTVHDEFIVTEEDSFALDDFLYTVALDEMIYQSRYFRNSGQR